jgi:hypothetical protein
MNWWWWRSPASEKDSKPVTSGDFGASGISFFDESNIIVIVSKRQSHNQSVDLLLHHLTKIYLVSETFSSSHPDTNLFKLESLIRKKRSNLESFDEPPSLLIFDGRFCDFDSDMLFNMSEAVRDNSDLRLTTVTVVHLGQFQECLSRFLFDAIIILPDKSSAITKIMMILKKKINLECSVSHFPIFLTMKSSFPLKIGKKNITFP